jgi:hypothetical protein
LRREETELEPRSMTQYPKDMIKNKDPASSWPIFRSFSMVGKRGARITRETKFRKKSPTRKRRDGI